MDHQTRRSIAHAAHRPYYYVVFPDSNECPANPKAVAEDYMMRRLSKEQEAAFEDHFIDCNRCATLVRRTAEYVEAVRPAAKNVRSESDS